MLSRAGCTLQLIAVNSCNRQRMDWKAYHFILFGSVEKRVAYLPLLNDKLLE